MASDAPNPAGPLEVWRAATVKALEIAGRLAEQVVASQAVSAAVARSAQSALQVITPLRQAVNQLTENASQWTNLPTRAQVVELARRVNRLELILDDLDVKTDELLRKLDGGAVDGDG